jgi:hypothetical protein
MIRYMYACVLLLRLRQLDLSLVVVHKLPNLDTTQVVLARNARVVVEQIPLALELSNRVVRRPALDRLQDAVLVCERPKWRVANRVRKVVSVASRVGEVVFAVVLVHPGSLEEATVVLAGVDWLAVCVVDDKFLHVARESVHVVTKLGHTWHESRFVTVRFHGFVGFALELAGSPALELTTPDAAEVKICLAIVVDKAGRVDAVAAGNVVVVRLEGTLWRVGDGDTDSEDTLLVSGWEVKVVFAILLGGIGGPELLINPGNVLCLECNAVVGDGTFDIGHGKDVVVVHIVLVAIIVVLDICLPVVRWVDV